MEKNKEIEPGIDLADLAFGFTGAKSNSNQNDSAIILDNPEELFGEENEDTEIKEIGSSSIKEVQIDEMPQALKDAMKGVKNKKASELEEELKNEEPFVESNPDDLGEYESDVVDFFTNKLSEKLEWSFEDEEKPKSVDEVINLLNKIVEENSRPSFASDKIESLNEFVNNGGKFEDYYNNLVVNRLPLDIIDIDSESHQKTILKEDLLNKGLTDTQIERKLKRWEDAGVLQEEAEEAFESVKEYRVKTEQKLLEDQKNLKKAQDIAQQKFFSSVDKVIKDTKDILGVQVSEKAKKETAEYIFRPDSDGYSKFYKETGLVVTHETNPKLLLEIAYLAKNASAFANKIEKKVETKAAKTLKEKLATKGSRGINQGSDYNSSANIFSSLGSQLLPK